MTRLEQLLSDFLKKEAKGRSFLLGLSGGCDSLSLFHLLLDIGCPFHVAHVDHGWREESRQEAKMLEKRVKAHGLPFHRTCLQEAGRGNLENGAREERFRFFRELCGKHGLPAVMVGHHADDQAETVMTRLLTSAPCLKLRGMKEVVNVEGLTVWRPLLQVRRKELEEFLKEKGIEPFDDATNYDTRRLRARLRHAIFPYLSKEMGREVVPALLSLGEETAELAGYLDTMAAPLFEQGAEGVLGWRLHFDQPLHPVLMRHLVRKALAKQGIDCRREMIKRIGEALAAKEANLRFEVDGCVLFVDRGHLMIPRPGKLPEAGEWSVSVKRVDVPSCAVSTSWSDLWEGRLHAVLPFEQVEIVPPTSSLLYPSSQRVGVWWNKHRVPAWLRSSAPLVASGGEVVHEFLTGKVAAQASPSSGWCEIKGVLHS